MKFYRYVDGEYVPEANDINYKANQCTLVVQCRQTFLETAFSYVLPENGQGEIFTERTLVKFNTVSEILPLIFTRFTASVLDGDAKGINKCPVCGKYFIPVKGKEHRFCSDGCRISTYENPYYKKYRNRDLYIGRSLDTWAFQKPGDGCETKLEKLKTQHKIWQNWVRSILPTTEQVYGSPDEFGKAISAEWKRLKKEVC